MASQIILTSNCVKIWVEEVEESLFEQIHTANKVNDLCNEYHSAMTQNLSKLHGTHLHECQIVNEALFKNNLLWVSKSLHTKLLQEVYDQSSAGHSGMNQTVDLIHCYYYWFEHVVTVKQYIHNCHHCQRSKTPCDSINELLTPLPISKQCWQDIFMNFITELPLSENYNAICTIIDRLLKERHYVPCHSKDEGTSIEEIVQIMLWNVYCLHDLSSSIVSDQGSQFISTLWKSMCKWLKIKVNLFTAFHSETDSQTEQANQDVEQCLHTYCNYMQDDWAKWLSMIEFSDNNSLFSVTSLSPFYFDKGFHLCMSFSSDITTYESTCEWLQSAKVEDIVTHLQKILNFDLQQLKKSRVVMKTQTDKHWKDVSYEIENMIWLSDCNIKSIKSCHSLKDKQLRLYWVIEKVKASYRLKLLTIMWIHNVFNLKLLHPCL